MVFVTPVKLNLSIKSEPCAGGCMQFKSFWSKMENVFGRTITILYYYVYNLD